VQHHNWVCNAREGFFKYLKAPPPTQKIDSTVEEPFCSSHADLLPCALKTFQALHLGRPASRPLLIFGPTPSGYYTIKGTTLILGDTLWNSLSTYISFRLLMKSVSSFTVGKAHMGATFPN
jgi:hypothetical protein